MYSHNVYNQYLCIEHIFNMQLIDKLNHIQIQYIKQNNHTNQTHKHLTYELHKRLHTLIPVPDSPLFFSYQLFLTLKN